MRDRLATGVGENQAASETALVSCHSSTPGQGPRVLPRIIHISRLRFSREEIYPPKASRWRSDQLCAMPRRQREDYRVAPPTPALAATKIECAIARLGDTAHVILPQVLRFAGLADPLLAPPKPGRHSKLGRRSILGIRSKDTSPGYRSAIKRMPIGSERV